MRSCPPWEESERAQACDRLKFRSAVWFGSKIYPRAVISSNIMIKLAGVVSILE